MQPFKSAKQMRDAHQAMFGDAGRKAAEIVLEWAPRLFAVPIDPLTVRVVLAPVEIGPYNKHTARPFCSPTATIASSAATRSCWTTPSRISFAMN